MIKVALSSNFDHITEVIKQWEESEQWLNDSYTVLFVGTPSTKAKTTASKTEKTIYEPEFIEPLHMDLKRDVSGNAEKPGNATRDTRGLFEKYQFFTPGKLPRYNLRMLDSVLINRRYLHGNHRCHCAVLPAWRWSAGSG